MIRVGQGYDIHRLESGIPLLLGGVRIPFEKGLKGHSDGDALLHAITDALLGAAGLGDIGQHFPDTDPKYKGADSRILLKNIWEKVKKAGWELSNVDASIIAQAPRLAEFIPEMKKSVALLLNTSFEQINIKAKTNENLGSLGRQEGIAVHVSLLLVKGA